MPQKIDGYRDLEPDEISIINEIKRSEVSVGELWRKVTANPRVDRRWAAIAKTHFEEGFSALVRSVARPEERF